jgi:hypothetical protein
LAVILTRENQCSGLKFRQFTGVYFKQAKVGLVSSVECQNGAELKVPDFTLAREISKG